MSRPLVVPLHVSCPAHSGSSTAAVKNSTANPDWYETTQVCGIARMPQTCVFVSYLDLQLNSSPLLSGYSLHELGSHATGLHQHPLVIFEQPLRLGLVPASRTNTRRQSSSRRHRHVVTLYPLIHSRGSAGDGALGRQLEGGSLILQHHVEVHEATFGELLGILVQEFL